MPKIAFIMDGGLGDAIITAAFIRDFYIQCGPMQLDICTEYPHIFDKSIAGAAINAHSISANHPDNDCDLILYCMLIPSIVFCNKTRINNIASPSLRQYVSEMEEMQKKEPAWFSMQDQYMGAILAFGKLHERNRCQLPYLTRTPKPAVMPMPSRDLPLFRIPGLQEGRPFITVHRGAGSCPSSTKLWSRAGYDGLIDRLRQCSDMAVIQIGDHRDPPLNVDIDLRGKTSLPQLARLMHDARLHLCSEGGTAHLRHALCRRPSVVFFGPTDPAFYGYEENLNLRSDVCHPCEWHTRDWQQSCARGFDACRSLEALTLEYVWQRIGASSTLQEILSGRNS